MHWRKVNNERRAVTLCLAVYALKCRFEKVQADFIPAMEQRGASVH